jgi:outer membrane protein assembly factor BamB
VGQVAGVFSGRLIPVFAAKRGDLRGHDTRGCGSSVRPAFEPKYTAIIQVAVTEGSNDKPESTVDLAVFAVDPTSGKVRWQTRLGRGPTPPAYKASVAMAHNGIIYVSNPAANKLYALDGRDGAIQWQSAIPHVYPTGLGRGSVTYHDGVIYQATGAYLYAWDGGTGKLLHELWLGGRFGITNPVIVGQTVFLANSWGWIMAVPLSEVRG